VAKHDDAYDWVANKRFEVNPTSGVLQYYDTTVADETRPAEKKAEGEDYQHYLFDEHDDEELLLAGIPQPLLTAVRAVITESDLDALSPHLPEDASEMLYLLAAGYTLMEAIEEADRAKKAVAKVDTEDFTQALARNETQRTFKIVEGEDELERMIDAPLEQWRVFLHPSQRKLVRMKSNGPVRVLGGAGTGKTVVLMHRANYLLNNIFTAESDRILVTTYTRNLALDLESNLKNLCGRDAGRLDVINLHGWAKRFMSSKGHSFKLINDAQKKKLMQDAVNQADSLEFDLPFYLDEWDHVVQANDVVSRDDYLTVRRVGRGTPLSRKQRSAVWTVFELYREFLNDHQQSEWADLIRETRLFIEKQKLSLPYQAVLSDEVQDFTTGELKLLRAIAPAGQDTMFVVGDAHQRIYGTPVTLGSCGIEIRGRSRRLKLNYRTTEQIGVQAIAILKGLQIDDLDGGVDSLKGYSALRSGPAPSIRVFESESAEADFIKEVIVDWINQGVAPESICISTRTHAQIDDRYAQILDAAGIEWVKVEKDPEAEASKPGVRLATMHRMKGLEFSRVLLAGVQAGKMPLEAGDYADYASLEDHELRERCLLYVACTRARDELVITGFGTPSPFFDH
jgi:superfamily I DNA/RNA helicase